MTNRTNKRLDLIINDLNKKIRKVSSLSNSSEIISKSINPEQKEKGTAKRVVINGETYFINTAGEANLATMGLGMTPDNILSLEVGTATNQSGLVLYSDGTAIVKLGLENDGSNHTGRLLLYYNSSTQIDLNPKTGVVINSIGTSAYPLRINNSSGSSMIEFYQQGSGNGQTTWRDSSGNADCRIVTEANQSSYINNGGSFGIATASPDERLHVNNGRAKIENGIYSEKGSFSLPASTSLTQTINFSGGRGSYLIEAYATEVGNGVWQASARMVSTGNSANRPNVSYPQKMQYSGNMITGDIEPYGGSNTNGYQPGDNGKFRISIVNNHSSTNSTVYWSVTRFNNY